MKIFNDLIDKHVVVRSSPSGVWLGVLADVEGSTVRLRNARRAWRWEGAASCSGLALRGPSGGKICPPVPAAVVYQACEILEASAEAVGRWELVEPWEV